MLNSKRCHFIDTIMFQINLNHSSSSMSNSRCSPFSTNEPLSSSIYSSSSKIGCFGLWFFQIQLSNKINFSRSYGIECLFNISIIDASANPLPSGDLFGMMKSLRLPKSHSRPPDPSLDASIATNASAKEDILCCSFHHQLTRFPSSCTTRKSRPNQQKSNISMLIGALQWPFSKRGIFWNLLESIGIFNLLQFMDSI